jgi:hypothetical protein
MAEDTGAPPSAEARASRAAAVATIDRMPVRRERVACRGGRGHRADGAAPRRPGAGVRASPTRPGRTEAAGRTRAGLVGAPPISRAVPHARLPPRHPTPEGLGGKLYYLLDPAGGRPPRDDAAPRRPRWGLFEVHDTDAAGRSVRRYVPRPAAGSRANPAREPTARGATCSGSPGACGCPRPAATGSRSDGPAAGGAHRAHQPRALPARANSTEHALAPLEARERRNHDAGPLRQLDQLR